ncbi:MAG TPA: helix-turn-helix transcriptional regulator [Friedmanniella sp.]
MRVERRYLPAAVAAATTLGALVAAGRRERGWTAAELAERLGVTAQTLRRLERGSPAVAVGLAFEAALLCGVELFSTPSDGLGHLAQDAQTRLALLPARVRRTPVPIDDDF